MRRDILKNIWRLRKVNSWIVLELFVVSVLLWFSLDYLYMYLVDLRNPIGFEYKDVYRVKAGTIPVGSSEYNPDPVHTGGLTADFLFFCQRLKEHPAVEEICYTQGYRTYSSGWSGGGISYDTLSVGAGLKSVSSSYFNVFRTALYDGRSAEDVFRDNGVICTEDIALTLLGTASPYGKKIWNSARRDSVTILGVCQNQKPYEFLEYSPTLFMPLKFTADDKMSQIPDIYFRVKGGMNHKDFEYSFLLEMDERLRIGNIYLEEIESLSGSRKILLSEIINEFRLYSSIILFLLVNIFLGVTGAFWLNTRSRRHEIGLRMAMGSSRVQIRSLLLGEGLALLLIAFIPALLVASHIQAADLTGSELTPHSLARFCIVQAVVLVLLTGMVVTGIWFPARRAMNTEPAEVLHEE